MTGVSSTAFSTSCAPASPRLICRANTARPRRSTTVSTGGAMPDIGTGSWKPSRTPTTWTPSWWMAHQFGPIILRRRSKKRPASLPRALARWVRHKNTCTYQSGRIADPVRTDARSRMLKSAPQPKIPPPRRGLSLSGARRCIMTYYFKHMKLWDFLWLQWHATILTSFSMPMTCPSNGFAAVCSSQSVRAADNDLQGRIRHES